MVSAMMARRKVQGRCISLNHVRAYSPLQFCGSKMISKCAESSKLLLIGKPLSRPSTLAFLKKN